MPSETFYRLPEEKRQRLMDAAWEEFTRTPFADASINKIILKARIPRGSFYQYFEDKNDLFSYLVRPMQQHFFDLARREVESVRGDLFSAPLRIYDRFFNSGEQFSQDLKRCTKVIQRNPDSEFHNLFCGPDSMLQSFTSIVNTAPLLRQDPEYLQEVFRLFVFIIASAILDTLNRPEKQEEYRQQLQLRIEILMHGCGAPSHEGGTL